MFKTLSVFIIAINLTACISRDTSDPEDAYKYWAGEKAPDDVKVLHGKYWKSGHWSYEFEVYLHLRAPRNWKLEFFRQHNLKLNGYGIDVPREAPEWFNPPSYGHTYTPNGANTGPFYVEDTARDELFIYEIQL